MKRRTFVAGSVIAPVAATATVEKTEAPKTARYAILVSEAYDRGAWVAFSLPEAIRKATEWRGSEPFNGGYLSIEVYYVDGRDPVCIDEKDISHPSLTTAEAQRIMVQDVKNNLDAYWRYGPSGYGLGLNPDEHDVAEWERTANGPTDEEIEKYRQRFKRRWFSSEELAEYERKHIA